MRTPESSTLENIERFVGSCGAVDHDVYLCSTRPGPVEWLESRPQFTWLRVEADQSLNGKAATLSESQRYWSGDLFVVSDADMLCEPDYLDAVLGEFSDPEVGVVTCLYRSEGEKGLRSGSVLERLCIQDFAASALVAERTEGIAFCFGSTMAVRREVLEQIGGFEALVPYLADDYQLGYRAVRKGWKVALAPTVLATDLGKPTFRQAWEHQYRWMVTSRVSRPGGHAAFIVTQGLLWSLLLFPVQPLWLLFWCFLRVAAGLFQGSLLGGEGAWKSVFLPFKDLAFLVLWFLSLRGNVVYWGGDEVTIVTKIVEIVGLETEISYDAICCEIDSKTCLFTHV